MFRLAIICGRNSWQISDVFFVSESGGIDDMPMRGKPSPRLQSLAFFWQPVVSMQLSGWQGEQQSTVCNLCQQLSIAIASAGGRSCASGLDTFACTCVLISLPPLLHLQLLLSNSEVALQPVLWLSPLSRLASRPTCALEAARVRWAALQVPEQRGKPVKVESSA